MEGLQGMSARVRVLLRQLTSVSAPVAERSRSVLTSVIGLALARHLRLIGFTLIAALFSTTSQAADTKKPTIPSVLTAIATSGTQVNLSWTASTDNVGVTGYRIERCTGTSCTTWSEIATPTSTAYSDAGLTTATTYRYRIRANDAAGNLSNYSSAVTVKTLDDQAPTAPTGLTSTVNSPIKITVSWTAATDNVAVKGYRIERCTGAGCSDYSQIATTTTAVTYANTGLTPVTTYQYRVRANDAAGNLSTYSTSVSATTSADTTKPTAPTALTATVVSNNQIDLSWTASTDAVGVTGYRIERCTGATCTNYSQVATSIGPAYSNTGLSATTTYRYRVRAIDAAGNLSKYSTVINATTQVFSDITPPIAPTNLTATVVSATQINLGWEVSIDDVGVTAYLLERCQGLGCSTYVQIASLIANKYNDTELAAATNYSYRVRAKDAANNSSSYSNNADAVTQHVGPITVVYTYDALGRISRAASSDGSVIYYQYDANGNVTVINRQ